jgi:hypothetical protein
MIRGRRFNNDRGRRNEAIRILKIIKYWNITVWSKRETERRKTKENKILDKIVEDERIDLSRNI